MEKKNVNISLNYIIRHKVKFKGRIRHELFFVTRVNPQGYMLCTFSFKRYIFHLERCM